MWDFICENKEIIFGGSGTAIVVAIIGLLIRNKKKGKSRITMTQQAGNNSTNYQSAESININKNDER